MSGERAELDIGTSSRDNQWRRERFRIIKPFSPSNQLEPQPQITSEDIKSYFVPRLRVFILSRTARPTIQAAYEFLEMFTNLKLGHAQPEKDLSRETLIVRATTLGGLIDIVQEEVKGAFQYRGKMNEMGRVEVMMEADWEIFKWLRIHKVLETARALNPPVIALTTQNHTAS